MGKSVVFFNLFLFAAIILRFIPYIPSSLWSLRMFAFLLFESRTLKRTRESNLVLRGKVSLFFNLFLFAALLRFIHQKTSRQTSEQSPVPGVLDDQLLGIQTNWGRHMHTNIHIQKATDVDLPGLPCVMKPSFSSRPSGLLLTIGKQDARRSNAKLHRPSDSTLLASYYFLPIYSFYMRSERLPFRRDGHHIQGLCFVWGVGFQWQQARLKRLHIQKLQLIIPNKLNEGLRCSALVICFVFERQPAPPQTVLHQLQVES